MAKFRTGEGGEWLVTVTLSPSTEVVNSCKTYKDAVLRAEDLALQSPNQEVTLYQAVARFSTNTTPVQRKWLSTPSIEELERE